jgi:hypothetical protein
LLCVYTSTIRNLLVHHYLAHHYLTFIIHCNVPCSEVPKALPTADTKPKKLFSARVGWATLSSRARYVCMCVCVRMCLWWCVCVFWCVLVCGWVGLDTGTSASLRFS